MDEALALALRASLGQDGVDSSRRVLVEQAAVAFAARKKTEDEKVVKALTTVLENVREYASDARYRRLRLSNRGVQRVWRCPAARCLLEAIGWSERGDVAAVLEGDGDGRLSSLAFEILTEEVQQPTVCQVCGRQVAKYPMPPRGSFFRRARAPWEGVVCPLCPDFLLCGHCFNHGQGHDHALAPLGYEEGPPVLSRLGAGGHAPRRPPPSHRDSIHGRRGPWG
mmetsp:Transcript_20121/g.62226  ORF Transcript_20121/g.62226 Transcript_20121/m.62226 type:complete len:224 (+) Transcript_20121:25-696(+)